MPQILVHSGDSQKIRDNPELQESSFRKVLKALLVSPTLLTASQD